MKLYFKHLLIKRGSRYMDMDSSISFLKNGRSPGKLRKG